jgi:hypothetical protein
MERFENNDSKKFEWDEALRKLDDLTRPELRETHPHEWKVDQHIRETVAAFNVNGFNTLMSCEGHHDRGSSVPYIDMQDSPPPEVDDSTEAETWRRKKLELLEKMQHLVNEFSAERQTPAYAEIVCDDYPGTTRVHCRGDEELSGYEHSDKDTWDPRDQQELLPKIEVCRGEMQAFASFLKQKFMEQNS